MSTVDELHTAIDETWPGTNDYEIVVTYSVISDGELTKQSKKQVRALPSMPIRFVWFDDKTKTLRLII